MQNTVLTHGWCSKGGKILNENLEGTDAKNNISIVLTEQYEDSPSETSKSELWPNTV